MNIFRLCKIFQGSKSRNENMNIEEQRRVRGVQNFPIRGVNIPRALSLPNKEVNSQILPNYEVNRSIRQINSYSSLPYGDHDFPNRNITRKKENNTQRSIHTKWGKHPFIQNQIPRYLYNNFSNFGIPFEVNDKENKINLDYLKKQYLKNNNIVDMRNRIQQRGRKERIYRLPSCVGMSNARVNLHNTSSKVSIEDLYMRNKCADCPFLFEKLNSYSSSPRHYEITDLSSRVIKSISDHITFLMIENFLSSNCCYKPMFDCLKNIFPIYLITGYVYLRRYLKYRLRDFKQLFKIFISCCWIAIKATNDTHISCNELLDDYSIDPEEISFIEAHILSKINYDIEVSEKEILEVIE